MTQEEDQRLAALPLRTMEHVLALLPAAVGGTPRDRVPSQAGRPDSALTGADVRMAAASTVANLSRSLTNRWPPGPIRVHVSGLPEFRKFFSYEHMPCSSQSLLRMHVQA